MMEKIGAWIYDPKNAMFKGMSKRAALYEVFCQDPSACDLLAKDETCLLCSGVSGCKFGRRKCTEGFTRRAHKYYSWMSDAKERNADFIGKLKSLKAWNRVVHMQGHWYLPYSHMATAPYGSPLESEWVSDADMVPELLERICTARPSGYGGELKNYQEKEVPKFISDLDRHYPELFNRLSDDQKSRLATISYKGRKADLTTCAPGSYKMGTNVWHWDGDVLTGKSMLFQPCKGDLTITINPEPGSSVEISDNSQVTSKTVFLD